MTKPKAIARFKGVDESSLVGVKLAHPLSKTDKARLGIHEGADTNVGDEIKVRSGDAQTLINAGYAQIDPEDNVAVAEALGQPRNEAEPTSTSGNKASDKS